jgi:hypothetical protein
MEKINNCTELNGGDWLLIKKVKPTFEDSVKECIGVLRDYDPRGSMSGCILKYYYRYLISGKIKESGEGQYMVFCWYKKGFIVLCKPEFTSNDKLGEDECFVNIYKLSEKEINQFKGYMDKCKILEVLQK